MYDRIVFDKPSKEEVQYKFIRCVYSEKKAHDKKSSVTCVTILPKGVIVTGGTDSKIRFWDPIGLHCMAIISEQFPILKIINADQHIYYLMT
jgi:WD40 repeat protein